MCEHDALTNPVYLQQLLSSAVEGAQRHAEKFQPICTAPGVLSEPLSQALPFPCQVMILIFLVVSFQNLSFVPRATTNACPTPTQTLVAPHIDSYNFFLEDGLAEAVKDLPQQVMQVGLLLDADMRGGWGWGWGRGGADI